MLNMQQVQHVYNDRGFYNAFQRVGLLSQECDIRAYIRKDWVRINHTCFEFAVEEYV
jgi:hypothetical protein